MKGFVNMCSLLHVMYCVEEVGFTRPDFRAPRSRHSRSWVSGVIALGE